MGTLTGLAPMLRLTVRRSWVFWALWIAGLAMMMPATASQYDTIIPPGTDPRLTIEPLLHNPTMLALLGPVFDAYDKGGFIFWRSGGFTSIAAGMMGGFGIIRATRGDEEEGRIELIRSGPVGRHAPLGAAIIVGLGASLLLALVNAAALIGLGLAVAGSIAASLAYAANSAIFVGAGALAAQVFESARTARGWTLGIGLGGAYLLRAMIDGNGPDAAITPLRWAIPIEWGMLTRPFADERWWVFALPAALTTILIALAFVLEARRDHGAGLRPASLGRSEARPGLSGAWPLAWRLNRNALIGWSISLVVAAIGFGSIATQMDSVFEANPQMGAILQRMGGTAELKTAFFIGILGIMATVVALMSVTLINTARLEESRGHAEALLATATSRQGFLGSHLVIALLVPALLLVAVSAGLPLTQALHDAQPRLVADYAGTGLALLPGLVLVLGVATALIGWAPRAFALVWALLGWTIFCTWFGALLNLPEWLIKLEPWGYLSKPPRDEMDWAVFAIQLGIGVVLIVLGMVGFRRRDISGR